MGYNRAGARSTAPARIAYSGEANDGAPLRDRTVPRHYQKDPIANVVCSMQFIPSIEWDATLTGLIYGEMKAAFPKKRLAIIAQGPGLEMNVSDQIQLWREDETAYAQVGPNQLSIVHNAPYSGWEEYVPLIDAAVAAYRKVAAPSGLQRVGLRYINRIVFDAPSVQLDSWFEYHLKRPEAVGNQKNTMVSFAAISQYAFDEERVLLTQQLASGGQDPSGGAVCLLDLDCSTTQPGIVTLDGMVSWLDNAHTIIKQSFESSIKPELRERFQPIG